MPSPLDNLDSSLDSSSFKYGLNPGTRFGAMNTMDALKSLRGGGGDHYASDLLAGITRSQWSDYQNRFVPLENILTNEAMNPDYTGRIAKAEGRVNDAFTASKGDVQSRLHGFGLDMTDDQKKSYDRRQNLSQGLSDVEAANRTRDDVTAERYQILTGSGAFRGGINPRQGG